MSSRKNPETKKVGLTSAEEYQAMRLNNYADKLLGIPFRHGRTPSYEEINQLYGDFNLGKPLREPIIADTERLEIASFLRALARNPKVIKAMLEPRKRRGAPTTKGARNWYITLDYDLAYKRHGKAEAALTEIMAAWQLGRTAVFEACKARQHAKFDEWAQFEQSRFAIDHADLTDSDLSIAHSEELRKSG